jgi:hypothetical protein
MDLTFRWTLVAAAIATCVMTTGCISRSRSEVTVTGTTSVSKGQELIDLQRALEAGAISQGDYEKVRAKIMKRDK